MQTTKITKEKLADNQKDIQDISSVIQTYVEGERKGEAFLRELHVQDVHAGLACPHHLLEPLPCPPTARRLGDVEAAVGRKGHAVVCHLQSLCFEEDETGALVHAVDLLQFCAKDAGVRPLGDKEMARIGPELSLGRIK